MFCTVYLQVVGLLVGFWEVFRCKFTRASIAYDSHFRLRRFQNMSKEKQEIQDDKKLPKNIMLDSSVEDWG